MNSSIVTEKSIKSTFWSLYIAKPLSYIIFVSWALITLLPLVWMTYSSFKTNEELSMDIYSLPKAMFDNKNDEFVVVNPQLNIMYPSGLLQKYGLRTNQMDEISENILIIESTTIAPGRRIKIHFLEKSELIENGYADIANLQNGDKVMMGDLPKNYQRSISWDTVWWNYTSAWNRGGLAFKFLNSILYTFVSTFAVVLLGLMVGYGISKFRYKKIAMVIAALIGLGYLIDINQVIIPLFLLLSSVNLVDTHFGIILVYTAFGLPLSVMLSSQFIKGLPGSLIESAYIDGATPFRTFTSIIVPMTIPVVITICVMSGLGIWNEFILVLVLASSEATKSLPVGVFSFSSRTGTQLGWQIAALIIATVPVLIVYLTFQKRLAEGVAGGAVKG
ncbi:MAG: carbohydrate ABC transporter permease [Spirochaetales bacterium]